jgi:hypothetical protein
MAQPDARSKKAEHEHVPTDELPLELFGMVMHFITFVGIQYMMLTTVAWSSETPMFKWYIAALLFTVFLGYVVADLFSGLVHFLFDRFMSPTMLLLGPHFVVPFREHHSDPQLITTHGFISLNANNCLACFPVLAIFIGLPFDFSSFWQLMFVSTFTWGSVAILVTNSFHKWAHDLNPPPFARWLQKHHIILPRDHHAIHHSFPYKVNYCITSGWCNRFLGALNAWTFFEWVGQKVFRMEMYEEPKAWEYESTSTASLERTGFVTQGVVVDLHALRNEQPYAHAAE